MNTLYLIIGVIILIMGVVTYFKPSTVRFISLSRRPRITSIMTLILGVAMIIVGIFASP